MVEGREVGGERVKRAAKLEYDYRNWVEFSSKVFYFNILKR